MLRRTLLVAAPLFAGLAFASPHASHAQSQTLTADTTTGKLEVVHRFYGAMPTGVTVSQKGRIFVNFPRWGDKAPYTVAEIKNGREIPFPSKEINALAPINQIATVASQNGTPAQLASHLVSVQSVVVDPKDRLWILDTGSPLFLPSRYGGPKLVCVNLDTNKVERTILMPRNVAGPSSYLNDIRFDLRKGKAGYAYITDSSGPGPSAIIVVDLASGVAFRRLNNHPTTLANPRFVPFVEGQAVMQLIPGQNPKYLKFDVDGIAISADGSRIYYCPVGVHKLYSVSTDALINRGLSDAQVAKTIIDHGEKVVSDGLETDDQNRVYCTAPEIDGIVRRTPSGMFETVVRDPHILWPDTMSVASDRHLYFISNQLHRQPNYHYGKDLRRKPYVLFRTPIDAGPVLLK